MLLGLAIRGKLKSSTIDVNEEQKIYLRGERVTENDQIELIHRCHHDGNQTNRETKFNHHLIVNPQNSQVPKSQTD